MTTITLGNIGQLPAASSPDQGANYRALSVELLRIRAELPHAWASLSPEEKNTLYRAALKAGTTRPRFWHVVRVTPHVIREASRLHRAGQFGDFLDYGRTLELVWEDILSLSENDVPAFQRDVAAALEGHLSREVIAAPLNSRSEIDEWLRSLL